MNSLLKSLSVVCTFTGAAAAFGQQAVCPPLIGHDIKAIPHQGLPIRHLHAGKHGQALVLFDSTTSFGWAGDLYGQMLADLLTHVDHSITLEPVESYKAGDMKKFSSAYYLGFIYNNALPAAFLTDVQNDTKPFCWCGFNLWELAWTNGAYQVDNPAFVNKTGFRFMGLDSTGYSQVTYQAATLTKNQQNPTEGQILITNPKLATAMAMSVSPSTGASIPYVTQGGGNFWYVADNPFMDMDAGQEDRLIAFGDLMHNITGVTHATNHRAFIRIEDVSAFSSTTQLRAIADTLYADNVPFEVCVIPEWEDPNGVFFGGVPTYLPMNSSPDFISALKYMRQKGGQIIMHGDTHQYSNVANAIDAVSADDFEFWRTGLDVNGNLTYVGPIPEDSPTWVHNRIQRGLTMLNQAGFNIRGWNTPHYAASSIDYEEIANDFNYSLDRQMVFSNVAVGSTMTYLNLFSPFTYTDEHGLYHVPETCGYVNSTGYGVLGLGGAPSDLVNRAAANLACRDGWAGCYFHWFLGTDLLQQVVTGIQGLGYTFVSTNAHLDDN